MIFNNLSFQLLVELGLVQRSVYHCLCLFLGHSSYCLSEVWQISPTLFLIFQHCKPLFSCFQPSSQLKGHLVLRGPKGFFVSSFSWPQSVSTSLFMLKSKTSCKMSSPFLPLPKLFLISLLLTCHLEQIVSVQLSSPPSMFLVVDFLCLIYNSVHSRVHLFICPWAHEVQFFSLSVSSSSFISFFHSE